MEKTFDFLAEFLTSLLNFSQKLQEFQSGSPEKGEGREMSKSCVLSLKAFELLLF